MSSNSTTKRRGSSRLRLAGGFAGMVVALGALTACLPDKVEVVEIPIVVKVPKCKLVQFNEGRKFVIDVWAVPDSRFDIGEPLRLQMRVSSPSYMSVFHVSTSCKVTRLLRDLPMTAAKIVDFPLRDSGIEMIVKPPAGEEGFYFIASRQKLKFLSSSDILRESGGGIASIDLSPAQFYKRVEEDRGRMDPDDWSIKTLRTSVVAH